MGPDASGPPTELDYRPTTKRGNLWSPTPKNPKIAKFKLKHTKTEKPADTKSVGPI
uniref:Uncharacterized protein n=1 Tax=Peronospora matthiolae TaxID=2874970 RepID=A0AAV1VIW8_9STRA